MQLIDWLCGLYTILMVGCLIGWLWDWLIDYLSWLFLTLFYKIGLFLSLSILGRHHKSLPASRLSHSSVRGHTKHSGCWPGVSGWAIIDVLHGHVGWSDYDRWSWGGPRQGGAFYDGNGGDCDDCLAGGIIGHFLWIILRFTVSLHFPLYWIIC